LATVLITVFAILRYMKLRLDRTTLCYQFFVAQHFLKGPETGKVGGAEEMG